MITLSGKEIQGMWQKDGAVCPSCGRSSWNVPQSNTIIFHVHEIFWPQVKNLIERYPKGFRFCPHKGCAVAYFHPEPRLIITTEELQTRIGYKVSESPIPVCYCIGVLAETIREEILVKQCCDSLEDIKKYTGARTGKWCHITNPSGRCCGPLVESVIEEALKGRQTITIQDHAAQTIGRELLQKSKAPGEPSPPRDSCCLVSAPDSNTT